MALTVRKLALIGAIVLVFTVSAVTSALFLLRSNYRQAALDVCSLIETHYYRRGEPAVQAFLRECRVEAEQQSFLLDREQNITRINSRLQRLHSSHLQLFSPIENRAIWENASLDTGLRSRMIDGELVVTKVLPQSPAAIAGLRAGDSLLTLNGEVISSSWDAQTGAGRFAYSRKGVRQEIELRPEEITEDLSPSLQDLGRGVGLLSIPSFLATYFDGDRWTKIVKQMGSYQRLVIDVRGNAGGSFPAMLRAVSPFRCSQPLIGKIERPLLAGKQDAADMKDDLETESQLSVLDAASIVNLRSFATYGCFDRPVTVLIDWATASTAEIFAQAFFARKDSRVWGQPSSGQVVMAQWFPIGALGSADYQLSIPIADYRSQDGARLESEGLSPQRILHYDLDRALEGKDSWIEAASFETLKNTSQANIPDRATRGISTGVSAGVSLDVSN